MRTYSLPRLLGVLLLLALSPAARAEEGRQFNAQTFSLDNGLQVVVIENHRAPIVTQMVWYKVGSADEHRGKTGLAHFLEHLMFKGTKETPPGAFSEIVARNGGRENAFTTADYTAYFQNVAADRLELMMKLEAERKSLQEELKELQEAWSAEKASVELLTFIKNAHEPFFAASNPWTQNPNKPGGCIVM